MALDRCSATMVIKMSSMGQQRWYQWRTRHPTLEIIIRLADVLAGEGPDDWEHPER